MSNPLPSAANPGEGVGRQQLQAALDELFQRLEALEAAPAPAGTGGGGALPVGAIVMGTQPTDGTWVACDGTTVAAATYPEYASTVGTLYGGSGSNPGLPDFGGISPQGEGSTYQVYAAGDNTQLVDDVDQYWGTGYALSSYEVDANLDDITEIFDAFSDAFNDLSLLEPAVNRLTVEFWIRVA